MDFVVGGLAGVGAGFFSNPFDVVKTRMQLQGELQARGKHSVHYRNIPHAMYTIVKHDGVSALQKGLVPALWFQWVVNGVRTMDFVVGGLAGVGAGFFSNPFDVVKTRMQLQGELQARGKHSVHYRNIPHAMYTIVKHDGVSALQKGLVAALWLQWVVNGVRLGIYQQADSHGFLRDKEGKTQFMNSLLFGAIAGMAGGFIGSPLQLIKTQLMSYSSEKIAVGTQHGHRGTWFALTRIYKKDGLLGLWRGAHGMMLRNSMGSASQIASYTVFKEWLDANSMFQQSRYLSAFAASNLGALVKTVTLTPMDVIMTRLYNQGVDSKGYGVLYSGIVDCARKITKTEGLSAFYKGFGPSYLRQAPHTVLLLVFWDILKDMQNTFQKDKAK